MLSALLISFTLLSPAAQAGKCDTYIRRADSASGASLISAFSSLAQCDAQAAEDNFIRFMTRATDSDTLSQLSLAAISADVWNPVWTMPGKIKDYEARDIVTNQIGEACASNEKVATFLQGAYAGIKEVDFNRWEDALVSCDQDAFGAWITQQIENPPAKAFDGKFDTLIKVYLKRTDGAAALPSLQTGAIAAAGNGGPYDVLIKAMSDAVTPNLGGDITPEDQAALTEALVAVANEVPADKAKAVADALYISGNESAAAGLLPVIYSDRVQSGGGFVYAAAAVEAGECKGTQTAIIHYAEVSEAGQRYSIETDDASPLRSAKKRLKKCTSEGEWTLRVSNQPLDGSGGVRDWVGELEQEWAGKGYEVSVRSEAGISAN